jgi:hypothetical protein
MTGVRSPAETKDLSSSLCVQTGSGAHPASCTMSTGGLFPGLKRGRGVTLTTHPHLVPRSRMSRSYTFSSPNASVVRSDSFSLSRRRSLCRKLCGLGFYSSHSHVYSLSYQWSTQPPILSQPTHVSFSGDK